jgi:hypothetical protein
LLLLLLLLELIQRRIGLGGKVRTQQRGQELLQLRMTLADGFGDVNELAARDRALQTHAFELVGVHVAFGRSGGLLLAILEEIVRHEDARHCNQLRRLANRQRSFHTRLSAKKLTKSKRKKSRKIKESKRSKKYATPS